MLVTNHVLSGAVLGAAQPLAGRPAAAYAAGFVSHLLLDQVPHWGDPERSTFLKVAVVDGLTGLTAMALMTVAAPRGRKLSVLAGMAGAATPDLDKPSDLFFGASPFPARFDAFHGRIQRESARRMPQEFLVAAGLTALALALMRR